MRLLIISLSVFCILLTSNSAKADRRVAFVVGNGAYKSVQQLPNAPVAAKSMVDLLGGLGFEVIAGTNLSRNEMADLLLEFGAKAQGADLAVFFFAGQGIAIEGAEYILPVDADIKSKMEIKLGSAINLDVTLEQTMGEAKVKLVFLDASRNDPFPGKAPSAPHVSVKPGLLKMKSLDNSVIAYATGPGQTALDGDAETGRPFTRALVANIAAHGVEIQQALTKVRAQVNEETNKRQLPWGHTNFSGVIYINPLGSPPNSRLEPN